MSVRARDGAGGGANHLKPGHSSDLHESLSCSQRNQKKAAAKVATAYTVIAVNDQTSSAARFDCNSLCCDSLHQRRQSEELISGDCTLYSRSDE